MEKSKPTKNPGTVFIKKKKDKFKQKDKDKQKINLNDYHIVYLVGNQYCDTKPSKEHTNIKFVSEEDNKYDKNAIKVISIRDGKEYKLGYIGKEYTNIIKNLMKRIKIFRILKVKNENNELPYYHILYTLTKYPIY
jgi:hypothetical protein